MRVVAGPAVEVMFVDARMSGWTNGKEQETMSAIAICPGGYLVVVFAAIPRIAL